MSEKVLTVTCELSTIPGSTMGEDQAEELLEALKLQISAYVASKGEGQLAVSSVVENE